MIGTIGRTTVLVHDQDEAKQFYIEVLGFMTIADMQLGNGFRALHVGPPGTSGTGLWLMPATTDEQRARVGNQTGGEPIAVIYTEDCRQAYAELRERGLQFLGEPVEEAGSVHVHFLDLYGNTFVLVELRSGETSERRRSAGPLPLKPGG
jgi:predicted enzyme related to lactoylglutathione lyase